MNDIENRADIEHLIDSFYNQVIEDPVIGEFFTKVIALDLEAHLPIMYDFWETMLLGTGNYKGNPMEKHIVLNRKKKLEAQHFERWLDIWESTVTQNFSGEKSDEAVNRAKNIAALMSFKVSQE